ncbi:uroporphyrinogen-III C-methyltransferase [Succinimonas sp.]|uniref:uroporphyrinogen-III C-methyltransferase n=1 Tax=Succinimonas sp. TaxID=1936151 RepID=UPI0038688EE2
MSDAMSDKNEIMENEQKNEDSPASLQDADAVKSFTDPGDAEGRTSANAENPDAAGGNAENSAANKPVQDYAGQESQERLEDLEKSVKRLKKGVIISCGLGLLIILISGAIWSQNSDLSKRPLPKNYDSAVSELRAENQELRSLINRMSSGIKTEFQTDIRSSESRLNGQVNSLKREQERINQALRELLNKSGDTAPDELWQIYEAVFLINIADRKMLADQDYVTARVLLQNADDLIRGLDDPRARELRASLAKDINTLGNMPRIDREGMLLRLQELSFNVGLFPLKSLKSTAGSVQEKKDISGDFSEWRQNLMNSLGQFMDSFITVRKKQPEDPELIDVSSEAALRENIRGYLLTAQTAFYRGDLKLFQKSLIRADYLIKRYFDNGDKVVINTREQIKASLAPVENVTPPTHLESQVTMRSYLKTTERKEQ